MIGPEALKEPYEFGAIKPFIPNFVLDPVFTIMRGD
jgi:hypothetical protein